MSKTAAELPRFSVEKSLTSSSREKISWSPLAQPRRTRPFNMASGKKPSVSYSMTAVAPWRLESFFLSGPRIMGTWPNLGRGKPRAL